MGGFSDKCPVCDKWFTDRASLRQHAKSHRISVMGPDFHQNPIKPHDHQCGMTSVGAWSFGCGHRWAHTVKLANSMKEYVEAHTCPKCGKGPWYFVLEDNHGTQ